ncbi:MAG: hypothetical protein KJ574_01720 [Nanoarchaeota archaeon]|nr:hypothetical protein [Nanoarchaeota archaeon]
MTKEKILFFLFLLLIVLAIGGCATQSQPQALQPSATPVSGVIKGVSLSPKSFQGSDFTDFFTKAKEAGSIVTWAGMWNEMSSEQSAPYVVEELSKQFGYEPISIVQIDENKINEEVTRAQYKESILDFIKKYKPRYVGIGNEINTYSPEAFDAFIPFYGEVYDAIKEASPDTRVFTAFNLETMKWLRGGLFGGQNDPAKAQWGMLEEVSKSDLIAFTTYPCIIYKDPAEIPSDYYEEIRTHTSKPIAFIEIGWFRTGPAGWESNDEEQAEFIKKYFELTRNLDPAFNIWSFLYDQDIQEPFTTMGLIKADGTQTAAWDEWVKN